MSQPVARRALRWVPWEGQVSLDICPWSSDIVVSHESSKERKVIPGVTGARLEYDDDGDGVVFGTSLRADGPHDMCFVLDEVFTVSVYEDTDGSRFFLQSGSNKPEPLSLLASHFSMVSVTMRCGYPRLPCVMDAAIFKWSCSFGMKVRWSLHMLYDRLDLHAHQGRRWEWVGKNFPTWTRYMEGLCPGAADIFAKAQPFNQSTLADPQECLVLPWPSVTTAGFLALLIRFSYSSSAQAGRLTSEGAVQVAGSMVASIVAAACQTRWTLRLALSGTFMHRWPRTPTGKNFQEFIVEDGRLNLRDLRLDRLDTPQDSMVSFFQSVAASEGDLVGLAELLQMAAAWRPRTSAHKHKLLGQLIVQIATQYEHAIFSSLEGRRNDSVIVERREIDPHRASMKEISAELLRYWQIHESRLAQGPLHLSLASDKSRVLGKTLLSTALVTPDNVGCWCFPVVRALVPLP